MDTASPSCPPSDALRALSRGELPPTQTRELSQHVEGCSHCAVKQLRLGTGLAGEDTGDPTPGLDTGARFAPLARGAALGRYVVLDVLGQGGMGVVYAAYDPELDRRVAVKLLKADLSRGGSPARLLREAQAMAKLSHPNVLAVHDAGSLPDGRVYLAMDLVEGQTLTAWLKQRRSWQQVKQALQAAGEGLWAAHRAGMVHRDFKPDNVLVQKDGRVFVTDFGLAKAEGAAPPAAAQTPPPPAGEVERASLLSATLTQADQLLGTPAYMAPEQFKGTTGDALSDQFSFGVTLYQALYGERPYDASARVSGWQVKEAPRGSAVPPWLRKVALRCVRERPEERYADLGAVLSELAKDPSARRRRLTGWGLAAVTLVGVAVGAQALGRRQVARCEGPSSLAQHWSQPQQQAVAAAFAASGLPGTQDTFGRVKAALDGYAQSWSAQRKDACEATRVRGEQSDEVLSLRMQCLDERRSAFFALVTVLETADKPAVNKAVEAAHGLPELADCENVEALRRPVKPPKDPRQAQEVAAVREGLARAEAELDTGHLVKAHEAISALLPRALAVGYRPLEAEALLLAGTVQGTKGDRTSVETLTKAVWAAQAGRADEVAARALMRLVNSEVNHHHYDEAAKWVPPLNAVVERLDRPDALRAQALIYSSYIENDGQKAEAMGREAVAIAQRLYGEMHLRTGQTWARLGQRMSNLERWEAAKEAYQRSSQVNAAVQGELNTNFGIDLLNLCRVHNHLYEYEQGIALGTRAVKVLLHAAGEEAVVTNVARMNLAEVLFRSGRKEEALAVLEVASRALRAAWPAKEPLARMPYASLAELELAVGKVGSARARFEELQGLSAEATPEEKLRYRSGLARADLAQGRARVARQTLEAVLPELLALKGGDSDLRVETLFGLAQALFATGERGARPRALAEQALAILEGERRTARAAEVRGWLEQSSLR